MTAKGQSRLPVHDHLAGHDGLVHSSRHSFGRWRPSPLVQSEGGELAVSSAFELGAPL